MISKSMEKALNKQINAELYSSYLYLSMAAYLADNDLPGFATWMRVQVQEENFHAMKMYDYVLERGGKVVLQAIESPQIEWSGVLDVFKETLAHEQKVTGLINDLVDLALDERDHATNIFLQWFVSEQVEEEASFGLLVKKLERIGDDGNGLLRLDEELAGRSFVAPAAE